MADTTIGTSVAIATPDLEIIEGQITTTSLQIAEHFSKRHTHVLRAIRNLLAELPENARPNFGLSEFTDDTGRKLPTYRITRDGFTLLAMGFTGKEAMQWKVAYLTAFNKMEQELQAKRQTIPYSVHPSQTLSAEQAKTLRELLTTQVKKLPHAKQAGAMVKGWSKLKAHFGTDYRHIPAREFHEAVSIIARHTAEWELVDETKAERAVTELVADWVKKIEEPNGYPAFLFLPLVEAVQRKTARTTGMLPEAQAREITSRLDRLGRLFHPFSDQAGDVIGVLRALRGLHPNSSVSHPSYLQLLPRI